MIVGDFLKATVKATVPRASNPVINTWYWRVITMSDPNALQNIGSYIADAIIDRYYVPLSDVISAQYVINSVELRVMGDDTEGYDIGGTLWSGGVAGNIAPRMVTYSVKLQRLNYNIRNGRKGYGGVPRSAIALDGGIEASVAAVWATVFDGWTSVPFTVEAGEADILLDEVIVRAPSTPNTAPTVYSPVASYSLNPDFGTQNSRK